MSLLHLAWAVPEVTLLITSGIFHHITALRILHFVTAVLFWAKSSYLASGCISNAFLKKVTLLFVCQCQVRHLLTGLLFLLTTCVYHTQVFRRFLAGPMELEPVDQTFYILVMLSSASSALLAVTIGLFLYMFRIKRAALWKELLQLEDALMFHEVIRAESDALCHMTDYYNIHAFMTFWIGQSQEDILLALPAKARTIYEVFTARMDTSADNRVNREEFLAFASQHGVVDVERLWTLFSDGQYITQDRIEDALYTLSFDRQRFAFSIKTDFKVVRHLMVYLSVVAYAGCFVFITRILHYDASFGEGFDLFKLYIFLVSFLATHIRDNLRFLLLMLNNRPFNLGDLLSMEGGQAYTVVNITPGFTALQGPTSLLIDNGILMRQNIINLTQGQVIDSVSLTLPLNYPKEGLARVTDSLREYAEKNKALIDEHSIQCGWARTDPKSKVLQCQWRYRILLAERTGYVRMRLNIVSHLIESLGEDLVSRALSFQAANGGAYNIKAKYD